MMDFIANEMKNQARSAVKAGLYKAGRVIAEASLKKVPRDTGRLAASIYIKPNDSKLSMEVGYSADYAVTVHENSEEKFLTRPFLELKERILNEVKESVEGAIE